MREDDRTLDSEPADRVAPDRAIGPGSTVSHFRIERELGAGGMGVVYEAYDPDLDRRVAIKLVRDLGAGSAAARRLVREAQAMARLNHPHVVAVHEVGTIDGQVFVVMERVTGDTLEAWLATPRSWRAVVEMFVQAGDGLAAAHHAGLVHRDFKPSNVLVDAAGRARVGDFGLARADDDMSASPALAAGSGPSSGGVVGTPAYMAPEQRAGEPVDARADQYAFAVALDDALHPDNAPAGERDRRADGADGADEDRAPASDALPVRLRRAIGRALAPRPVDRFATMDDLLAELRTTVRARRRPLIAVAAIAAAAIATGAAVLSWSLARSPDRCADSASLVDTVWTPLARSTQARQLAAARGSAADVETATTAQLLDDWAAAWRLGRRAACAADPVERKARLACLDRGLAELGAQLAVWRTADAAAADRAVAAAAGLPAPADCTHVVHGPVVGNPALTAQIADVDALERAGRSVRAGTQLAAMVSTAEAGGDPAALDRALRSAATVERELAQLPAARDHAARAAREAGRAGDDAGMLAAVLGEAQIARDQGRPLDALGLCDAAEAIRVRAGLADDAQIAIVRGDALALAGRTPEAIVELRRAVATLDARAAREPALRPKLAAALGSLAGALEQQYAFDDARTLLRRAQSIEVAALGPDHPEVGRTLHDLGTVEAHLTYYEDARADLERARTIFIAAYGAHHELVGLVDISLATLELRRGADVVARPIFERARDELPAGRIELALIEEGLGSIDRDQDHCADALPHFEHALAILDGAGRVGSELATALTDLGACQHELGHDPAARTSLERALVELEHIHAPPRDRVEPWNGLSDIAWHAGDHARAITLAEQVVAAIADTDAPMYLAQRAYARESLASWRK